MTTICKLTDGTYGSVPKELNCSILESKEWKSQIKLREKTTSKLSKTNSYVSKDELTSKRRIYYPLDNGNQPFKVVADNTGINIFAYETPDSKDDTWNINKYKTNDYPIAILTIKKFRGYWRGYDTSIHMIHGNSILIQLTRKRYICVGASIIQFTTDDIILDYVSPVGNNDVPYEVAYGVDNIYFIQDGVTISRKQLEMDMGITVINAFKLSNIGLYEHNNATSKRKYTHNKIKNIKILAERRI